MHRRIDWPFLLSALALVSISAVMVYSAESPSQAALGLGLKQWLGLIALGVGLALPSRGWRRAAPWVLVAIFVALVGLKVLPPPLVDRVKGATRWYRVPGIGQVQPAEFAKLAFALFGANFLDRRGPAFGQRDWIGYLGVLGALAGLIYLEPDLGTALVVAGVGFCLMLVAGVNGRAIATLVLIGAVAVGGLAWSTDHQRDRLLAWSNPWAYQQDQGHQVVQGWSAMVRGGWFGTGVGRSFEKTNVPEGDTDFLFAVIAAETGVAGATVVIGLLGVLIWRGYAVALAAPDRYRSLLAAGITSWIAVQSVLNIAVVTGALPNTGVPLPLLSRGVSSMAALLVGCGMVLRIGLESGEVKSRRRRTA